MKGSRSIQQELIKWVFLIACVLMIIGGLLSSIIVFKEAKDVQDSLLHEIAILVRDGQVTSNNSRLKNNESEEVSILIQPVNAVLNNTNTLSIPTQLDDGLQTLTLDGELWRANVVTQTSSGQRYIIAQQTGIRNDLALASGLNVFVPLLVLMVIMLLLIKWQITYQFKPLDRLAK